MKTRALGRLLCMGTLWVLGAWAHAQTPPGAAVAPPDGDRAAQRHAIERERAAVASTLQQAETACYQRFAVEDCLRGARRTARTARAHLAQREVALEEAERRERAAQRLGDIAERQSAQPLPVPPAANRAAVRPLAGEREQQAHERARQQQEKNAAHQAQQAEQLRAREAGAVEARRQFADKQKAAAARQARVRQLQADKAAAGSPAAPLPSAPAAPTVP